MKKLNIKENEFSGAPGGHSGAINYSTGWGTHASPSNTQYPDRFYQSQGRNTAINQTGGPAGGKDPSMDMPQQDKLQKDVEQIFQKKDTPSPDEVASALQFEMGRMITKDKARAKSIVLNNLKEDPHFYSNLHMLNIDDKKMKVDEIVRGANKGEIAKIFQEIAEVRSQKYEVKPEIASVIRDMVAKKAERSFWKRGLTSEAPKE
jgi:uncharacterized protein YdcH (DUF465 family)